MSFSSSSPVPLKYEVFLSFRGPDTRRGFLSHLVKALNQKKIETFADYRLQEGNEISPALLRAIEESQISLIIFSKGYAASTWCLEEAVKIIQCMKTIRQIVIPVFYEVDPSHVRKQKGSYHDAFVEHLKNHASKVENWRIALQEAANLTGFHSSKFEDEAELVEEIVKCVLQRLKNHTNQSGSNSLVALLESLLHNEPKDIRIIGLWDTVGIATTIASAILNRFCHEYEGCCFLENITEKANISGITPLKNKLFSILLDENYEETYMRYGSTFAMKRLHRLRYKKLLVVLDDVSDSEQLKDLCGCGGYDWFGPTSRIIVTTKYKRVLNQVADIVFEAKPDAAMPVCESELSFLKNFWIPNYILEPELEAEMVEINHDAPVCPVLVFINPKGGDMQGGDLLLSCRTLLNEKQVFLLGEETPDKVLSRIYAILEILRVQGDQLAMKIMERLKLIVAGGDGTVGWLLGIVCDLKLSHPPPIATIPLGTENNLPFAFGWGKKNAGTDRQSVVSFLSQVMKAKETKIDDWLMVMRAQRKDSYNPIAPLELPQSLHSVSVEHELNMEGYSTFVVGFWNYFSVGMDTQVCNTSHSEQKMHPEKFENQLVNQSTYAKVRRRKGRFSTPLSYPDSSHFSQLLSQIPRVSVRYFLCTLLSYSQMIHVSLLLWILLFLLIIAVLALRLKTIYLRKRCLLTHLLRQWSILPRNCLPTSSLLPFEKEHSRLYKNQNHEPIWSMARLADTFQRDSTPPFVDDGYLEVVGFEDRRHGLLSLVSKGHGIRLVQARRIRFEFYRGPVDHTFVSIDGKTWKQPLPVDDDVVLVEISHLGQVNVLATGNCKVRSVQDPSSPHQYHDYSLDLQYNSRIFSLEWNLVHFQILCYLISFILFCIVLIIVL